MNLSPDSRFYQFCVKAVSLVRINLLWILCSLPLFTIGAADAAMFSELAALRRGEETGWRSFFRAFRRCFSRSTVLWLLCVFLFVMLALDYRLVAYMQFPGRMAVICLICFCMLAELLVTGFVFPLTALTGDRWSVIGVNAVLLTLAHLPKAFLILAVRLLPLLLAAAFPRVFVFLSFILPVCGCALIAMYQLSTLRRIPGLFTEAPENTI